MSCRHPVSREVVSYYSLFFITLRSYTSYTVHFKAQNADTHIAFNGERKQRIGDSNMATCVVFVGLKTMPLFILSIISSTALAFMSNNGVSSARSETEKRTHNCCQPLGLTTYCI